MQSWPSLHQGKRYGGSQGGSASAPCCLHHILIFYTWGELLNALWKFPAPPLTCYYFTPCKGKKFLIQLIPPSPRNSTDPLTTPPWSFKKSQQEISARVSVFHRGIRLLICILSNRGEVREGAKYKQHISSPGSVPQRALAALPTP